MSFLIGLLMFVASYLLVGPFIASVYICVKQISKKTSKKAIGAGTLFAVIYIVLWVIVGCCLEKYVVSCVIAAIVALICAVVTFVHSKAEIYTRNIVAEMEEKQTSQDKISQDELDRAAIDLLESYMEERKKLLQELKVKVDSVYARGVEEFSKSELVELAINLISFNKNLSEEMYDLVEDKFAEYKKMTEKKKCNIMQFMYEIALIQKDFSLLIGMPVNPDGTLGKDGNGSKKYGYIEE